MGRVKEIRNNPGSYCLRWSIGNDQVWGEKGEKTLSSVLYILVLTVSAGEKMMQDQAETIDTGPMFEMESKDEIPQEVKLVDPERDVSQTLENPSLLTE